MSREIQCEVSASAVGIARGVLTLIVLMLVGLGFTLMSATAFADVDRPGGGGSGATSEVATPLNG